MDCGLFPNLVHYYKRGKKLETILASLIFATNAVPFVLIWSHAPSFDSEVWKNSINENRSYGGVPAYAKGEMVEDLIKSEILVDKTRKDIENILGKNNFIIEGSGPRFLWYFYESRSFLDGCDKVVIEFENGKSTSAGIGGCD